jgi:prepilin-type N-terminal cleavage/methylation domain-containing protein
MKADGYSLVEVILAAAVAAIGAAAGAAMVSTLVVQQEANAGAVRAANLQEQAVMLYRLGLTNAQDICNILPEVCATSGSPAAEAYTLSFGTPVASSANASLTGGSQWAVAYQAIPCTIVYASAIPGTAQVSYLSNTVNFVRPTIRVGP